MQELLGGDFYCVSNLLDARMCIRLKKIVKFQKGKKGWNVENLYGRKYCKECSEDT